MTKQLSKKLLAKLSANLFFIFISSWQLVAQAPVITSLNSHEVSYNNLVNFPITTTDPNGNMVTITASDLPSWLNITGNNYNVTTFVGSGTYGSTNGIGVNATFGVPQGIAIDSNKNIYVIDTQHHKIRKITPSGVVTTLAGSGNQGYNNGTTYASFDRPGGLVIDSNDNIFVADTYNHLIRKITPDGVVSIFAGGSGFNFQGNLDGIGTNAGFNQPNGITIDSNDNLYVADTNNHKIRKITPAAVVTTIADSSNGLNFPVDITIDSNNDLFVTEPNNHRILKVNSIGVVNVFAGTGSSGAVDGIGTSASFYTPYGITTDANNNLYVTEKGNQKIRKITSAGVVTTIAGNGAQGLVDGIGTNATFTYPSYITVDKNGVIYVSNNHSVRKLFPSDPYFTGVAEAAGQHIITLIATDTNYDVSNQTFTLTVKDKPLVVTTDVNDINVNAVTFNGEVTTDNFDAVTDRGIIYALTSTNASPELNGNGVTEIELGTGTGTFTNRTVNLMANTNYTYRAYATNGEGTSYGAIKNFTTLVNTPPIFSSEDNHSVSVNAAISFSVTAFDYDDNDNNDDPITITATSLPSWLNFTNNTLVGTAPATANQHTFTLTVTDSNNGITNQTFTLTIKDTPLVTTVDVDTINANSVTFNGDVTSDNFDAITERGIVYAMSNDNESPEINGNAVIKIIIGEGIGVFTERIENLTHNTNYNYRAYAINGEGISYGTVKNFTTLENSPPNIVSTNTFGVSVNTPISFSFNIWDVNENANNSDPVTVTTSTLPNWLSFTNNPNPTLMGTPTTAQQHVISITATDSNGGITTQDFTLTIKDKPIVTTTIANNIDANTATFSGEVITDNFDAIIERGIIYTLTSENATPELNGNGVIKIALGTGTGVFNIDLTTLIPNTVYSYRAYATNDEGTSYGTIENFTTLVNTPPDFTSANSHIESVNTEIAFPITTNDVNVSDEVTITALNLPNGVALTGETYNVSSLAGSGIAGNTDGIGVNTSFNSPSSAVVDSDGNMFITDQNNHTIRKITPEGVVTTFAGTGNIGSTDATGTSASFFAPYGIAIDSDDNLYIADTGSQKIRKITPTGIVTTIAGTGSQGFMNGTGTNASFNGPTNVAIDGDGNLYITDYGNHAIRKITPTGVVTTFAGNGSSGFINGEGTVARFNSPYDLAVDSNNNIFVADASNHAIRKITPAGIVSTFAGNEDSGTNDGTGVYASFNFPTGIAIDKSNTLYIGDTSNHNVRKITSEGVVTTIAGTGSAGDSNRAGANMSFERPSDIAVSENGILYILERTGQRIRKLQPLDYILSGSDVALGQYAITFTATDTNNGAVTQDFSLTVADKPVVTTLDATNISINSVTFNGEVITDNFDTVAERGIVYANMDDNVSLEINGNAVIKVEIGVGTGSFTNAITMLTPNTTYSYRAYAINNQGVAYGDIKSFSTLVDVPPSFTSADTHTMMVNTSVQLQIATVDPNNSEVKVTANNLPNWLFLNYDHVVSTTAGSGNPGADDGIGINTSFRAPTGIAIDSNNNIFVADQNNNLIRKISPDGVVSTFAGSGNEGSADGVGTNASFFLPQGIAIDSNNNLFIADTYNYLIRKISPDGVVSTFAGSGQYGEADGVGTNASFQGPVNLAIDSNDNLYVVDFNKIRKITPGGVVTTFAGSGDFGDTDGIGTNATFNRPNDIVIDSNDNIFVADSDNHKIRKITPNGMVSTFAGTGVVGAIDGTGTNALFNRPTGLAIDSSDNIYVADRDNSKIRKIAPDGEVSTIAGSGNFEDIDGIGTNASFKRPQDIATDNTGNLYITDSNSNRIRKLQFLNPRLEGYTSTSGQHHITLTAINTIGLSANQDFTLTINDLLAVNAKVFLQGALLNPISGEENLMRDDLRLAEYIPTISPYTDALIVNPNVFSITGNDAIVDWLYLELRDKNDITNVLYGTSALLQRDGDIVTTDGISPVTFEALVDDYYVAVFHRNHIAIATDTIVALSSTVTNLDFINNLSLIRGGDLAVSEVSVDVYAMVAGDANTNGNIQTTDINPIIQAIGALGYYIQDINLNGAVQTTDTPITRSLIGKIKQF